MNHAFILKTDKQKNHTKLKKKYGKPFSDYKTSGRLIKSVSLSPLYSYNPPNSHNSLNLLNSDFSSEINKSYGKMSDLNTFSMGYYLFCFVLSYLVMNDVSLSSHNYRGKEKGQCLQLCGIMSAKTILQMYV